MTLGCGCAGMRATERDDTIAPSTMPVTTSKDSPSAGEDQGDFEPTDGEAALHHVLSEVFYPDQRETVAEALERSGFNEIQDVLLMNQAERDMLTFLNANGVTTPLPVGPKSVLHCLKLFSCYCEDNGEPIMDWMKVSKAQFDQFRSSSECMWGIEKVTIPSSPKPKPDNANVLRNMTCSTSTPMISPSHDSQDGEDSGSNITELQSVLHVLLPEC